MVVSETIGQRHKARGGVTAALPRKDKGMSEYKITAYSEQSLDNITLQPKGNKRTKYCVYKKAFPFPNKSIFMWVTVKDGFKSEKEAERFLDNSKGQAIE